MIGETSPKPEQGSKNPTKFITDPHPIEDIHATIFKAMGIEYGKELDTPVGRPMKICQGKPIEDLLRS